MLAVSWATLCASAQPFIIDSFDTEADGWSAIWGTTPEVTFDATLDANAVAASGSLRVSADYFTPAADGWEQMVVGYTFETPLVGAEYSSVSVDVRIDPASVPATGGNFGYFEIKRPSDATPIGGLNLTSTNWAHITFNIPPTEGTLNGVIIQLGSGGFQGPVTYNLDNLTFAKKGGATPPPTLAIERNIAPGLKLFASAPGQAYQRQNIVYAPSEDQANLLWWVNQPDPVTYSVTWSDFPGKEQAGFQGHIMLAPDSGRAITPDWNDPNVIMIEFQYVNTPGADGQAGTTDDQTLARARFLHKINEPSQNAMLYRNDPANGPVGVLGELLAPTMLGTWSVKFENTSVVLTGPDNSTVQLTIPGDQIANYEPLTSGLSAIFGVQPNAESRIGESATISRIKIMKGATVIVDDTFQTSQLDPAQWTIRAQDPGGIFPLTPATAYLVSWNLPDTDFVLKTSSVVTGGWSDPGLGLLQVGARRMALVSGDAKMTFFRLSKP